MSQKISRNKCKIDDSVEEEVLVYVDIESTSMSESEILEAVHLKMVGNDKKLLLQVNNRFFEGNFEYSIGTHVYFEEDEYDAVAAMDPFYSQCKNFYKFIAQTNKILKMNRVLLKDQQQQAEEEEDVALKKDLSELKFSQTYEEALNLFLPPGKNPPRRIAEETEEEEAHTRSMTEIH